MLFLQVTSTTPSCPSLFFLFFKGSHNCYLRNAHEKSGTDNVQVDLKLQTQHCERIVRVASVLTFCLSLPENWSTGPWRNPMSQSFSCRSTSTKKWGPLAAATRRPHPVCVSACVCGFFLINRGRGGENRYVILD